MAVALCPPLFVSAQSGSSSPVYSIPTPRPLDPATNSTNPSAAATQSQNPYLGSVPSVPLVPGSRPLSLDQAVQLALRANLGLIDSKQAHQISEAERLKELAALLPNLYATASQHFTMTETTAATGGQKVGLPYLIGPYSYQSLDLHLTMAVFDRNAAYRLHAASAEMQASSASYRDGRNIVVLAAASAYIAIAASESRVHADQAELTSAKALESLMLDRVNRGVSPQIDLIRAKVAARTAEQRLNLAQIQLSKDKLALTRIIGLPIEQEFHPTTELRFYEAPASGLQALIDLATASRSDLKAATALRDSAALSIKAASAERMPSVSIEARDGGAGITPAHLYNNYDVGGTIRVPLFTGGRISADISEARAAYNKRAAEYQDLSARVNYDVRSAVLDLEGAQRSVSVATENLGLAQEGLKEAKDRFGVGLSNALEVIEAQQAVAEAENNYISSLYAHNLAKLMLIRATGTAEADLQRYLQGNSL